MLCHSQLNGSVSIIRGPVNPRVCKFDGHVHTIYWPRVRVRTRLLNPRINEPADCRPIYIFKIGRSSTLTAGHGMRERPGRAEGV